MRRKIPSTAALAAFEAAARHESFTLAGSELALTQSAVGRQVANLEEFIGVKLFRRTRRGMTLSPAGLQYSRMVRKRLEEVERDALEVASRSAGGGSIELGVVPTFATHWLVPRLPRFHEIHPGIHVNLHVRTRPFLFEEAGLDAAIHAGEGGWPGTHADLLMPEPMSLICAPALLGRRKRLSPSEVAALPLIQMTTRPYAWRQWFARHEISFEGDMNGPRVELFSMAVHAAAHGLGVALAPEYLVQDELARELLVSPMQEAFGSGMSYYFIYPENSPSPGLLAGFRDWVIQEARQARSPNVRLRRGR
ncbi:LysR family transcriptional regulator [Caenimonas soli]|uniref:LysR family transcriptional regulator n=1 Tax=Caenimonas soli TaxID=2735555 RepID=UPI001555289A|nr:LysR family transcriptional regulator [Caenimonas soli]NPC58162.1 LysR family transcriptional regulator [Caenimonas soli]